MTLVLYGIAGRGGEQIRGTGLEQRPLTAIGERSLVAVVSRHDRDLPPSSPEGLWEYERVVESLMAHRTILPARFGSSFTGAPEVRSMVRERHDQLAAALRRVSGAVEVSVTATWPEHPPDAESAQQSSGTAYMLGRVEQHRRARAIAAQLKPLSAAARDSSHRLLVNRSVPFAGAYLVDRAGVEQFTALVRDIDERLADGALVCTGPWPPYSFTPGDAP